MRRWLQTIAELAVAALLHAAILTAVGFGMAERGAPAAAAGKKEEDRERERQRQVRRVQMTGPGRGAESGRRSEEMPGFPVPVAAEEAPEGRAVMLPAVAREQVRNAPDGEQSTRQKTPAPVPRPELVQTEPQVARGAKGEREWQLPGQRAMPLQLFPSPVPGPTPGKPAAQRLPPSGGSPRDVKLSIRGHEAAPTPTARAPGRESPSSPSQSDRQPAVHAEASPGPLAIAALRSAGQQAAPAQVGGGGIPGLAPASPQAPAPGWASRGTGEGVAAGSALRGEDQAQEEQRPAAEDVPTPEQEATPVEKDRAGSTANAALHDRAPDDRALPPASAVDDRRHSGASVPVATAESAASAEPRANVVDDRRHSSARVPAVTAESAASTEPRTNVVDERRHSSARVPAVTAESAASTEPRANVVDERRHSSARVPVATAESAASTEPRTNVVDERRHSSASVPVATAESAASTEPRTNVVDDRRRLHANIPAATADSVASTEPRTSVLDDRRNSSAAIPTSEVEPARGPLTARSSEEEQSAAPGREPSAADLTGAAQRASARASSEEQADTPGREPSTAPLPPEFANAAQRAPARASSEKQADTPGREPSTAPPPPELTNAAQRAPGRASSEEQADTGRGPSTAPEPTNATSRAVASAKPEEQAAAPRREPSPAPPAENLARAPAPPGPEEILSRRKVDQPRPGEPAPRYREQADQTAAPLTTSPTDGARVTGPPSPKEEPGADPLARQGTTGPTLESVPLQVVPIAAAIESGVTGVPLSIAWSESRVTVTR